MLPSSNFAARTVTPGQLKDAPNDAMEVALRLGDLADLTVSNEAGPLSVDVSETLISGFYECLGSGEGMLW